MGLIACCCFNFKSSEIIELELTVVKKCGVSQVILNNLLITVKTQKLAGFQIQISEKSGQILSFLPGSQASSSKKQSFEIFEFGHDFHVFDEFYSILLLVLSHFYQNKVILDDLNASK